MIGWRVGWVAGPAALVSDAGWVHAYNTTGNVSVARRAAEAVLRGPQEHVARGGRGAASAAATRSSPRCPGWPIVRPAGGWSLLVDVVAMGSTPAEASAAMLARGRRGDAAMDGLGRRTSRRATCASCSAPSRSSGSRRWASGSPRPASLSRIASHRCERHVSRRAPRAARAARHDAPARRPLGQARRPARRRRRRAARRGRDRRARAARRARGARRTSLHGRPAAQSVGARLAGARGVSDLLLERNQAFRSALLDLQHVTTLLGYTAELARTRGDAALAAWQDGWARAAAGARGPRPRRRGRARRPIRRRAIAPADESPVGRAGARVGVAFGTIGEAIDNSPLGRLARRRAT